MTHKMETNTPQDGYTHILPEKAAGISVEQLCDTANTHPNDLLASALVQPSLH